MLFWFFFFFEVFILGPSYVKILDPPLLIARPLYIFIYVPTTEIWKPKTQHLIKHFPERDVSFYRFLFYFITLMIHIDLWSYDSFIHSPIRKRKRKTKLFGTLFLCNMWTTLAPYVVGK